MPLNIPIFLTWCRVAFIPVFIGVFYLPETWLSFSCKNTLGTCLFALAALTDWFDGYLARRLHQTSAFGAFLDPVADKLMVAAALILLVQLDRCGAWLAMVIIGREITISALREWMAQLGKVHSVAVAYIGKLKTTTQMAAVLLLLWDGPFLFLADTRYFGEILMYIAAVLTLWSMVYYLQIAKKQIPSF